jgi:hypothetical protein
MLFRRKVAVPGAMRQSDPVTSLTGSKYTTLNPTGSGNRQMICDLIDR